MNKLLIDTHSKNLHISLLMSDVIKSINYKDIVNHSRILMPSIKQILEENKIDLKDINEIIVVNGPGSFTGVRIGVTVAKTLAYCLNIPIKTISSLEALGESEKTNFDVIAIEDTKGFYSSRLSEKKYGKFEYRKKQDFIDYVKKNDFVVSYNVDLDPTKIFEYSKSIESKNPHTVNPLYIKEIDALK